MKKNNTPLPLWLPLLESEIKVPYLKRDFPGELRKSYCLTNLNFTNFFKPAATLKLSEFVCPNVSTIVGF